MFAIVSLSCKSTVVSSIHGLCRNTRRYIRLDSLVQGNYSAYATKIAKYLSFVVATYYPSSISFGFHSLKFFLPRMHNVSTLILPFHSILGGELEQLITIHPKDLT
jgi:hypothetical protein